MPLQSAPSVSRPQFESASDTRALPHVPILHLDRDGVIQGANVPARRVLGYAPDASIDTCFFSHMHGHNLRRVMRDLAHMVSHRKQRARWLLRLRTGTGRWRWYRAVARNHLDREFPFIRVLLRSL